MKGNVPDAVQECGEMLCKQPVLAELKRGQGVNF